MEVLEIQPETLTKFEVEEEFKYFLKVRGIKNVTDFDIRGFQTYLRVKYNIGSRSDMPHPLYVGE